MAAYVFRNPKNERKRGRFLRKHRRKPMPSREVVPYGGKSVSVHAELVPFPVNEKGSSGRYRMRLAWVRTADLRSLHIMWRDSSRHCPDCPIRMFHILNSAGRNFPPDPNRTGSGGDQHVVDFIISSFKRAREKFPGRPPGCG